MPDESTTRVLHFAVNYSIHEKRQLVQTISTIAHILRILKTDSMTANFYSNTLPIFYSKQSKNQIEIETPMIKKDLRNCYLLQFCV